MPSASHQDMVSAIDGFFRDRYGRPRCHEWLIRRDHERDELTPRLLAGYRPDFQATRHSPDVIVVGEAKTARDLQSERSQKQVSSFISHLSGLDQETAFILCVALGDIPDAMRFIRGQEQRKALTIHLIDRLGHEHRHAGWD